MTDKPHLATAKDAEELKASRRRSIELGEQLHSAQEQVETLTKCLRHIEQKIQAFVTSRALTTAQRLELLGLLIGTRTPLGAVSLPIQHAAEQRLLEHYRAMFQANRTTLSRLARQLAEADQALAKKGKR